MKKTVIIEKDCNDWEKIVIIEKDYDYWKGLWSLKKIEIIEKELLKMIIEKHCDYWKGLWLRNSCLWQDNFSSNVIDVIRSIYLFFFFYKKDFTHQKHKKAQKSTKNIKSTKAQLNKSTERK